MGQQMLNHWTKDFRTPSSHLITIYLLHKSVSIGLSIASERHSPAVAALSSLITSCSCISSLQVISPL